MTNRHNSVWYECLAFNEKVVGSIPTVGTRKRKDGNISQTKYAGIHKWLSGAP